MRIPKTSTSYMEDTPNYLEIKAERVAEIIADYENAPPFRQIDKEHVLRWVNQFEEDDREFLLDELIHILPNSYLPKKVVIKELEEMFDYFREQFDFDTVNDLLDHCCFISCQEPHKSQSVLLSFIDEIIQENYGRSVNECGSKEIKYWFYLDDVLASGGTFRSNLIEVINNHGYDHFIKEEMKILAVFFFLHSWGCSNSTFVLEQEFDRKIKDRIKFFRVIEVTNNPNRNRYVPSQEHNHAYPVKEGQPQQVFDYLESLSHAERNEKFAFRADTEPENESFFSSKDARIRYENILLHKGIELINQIEKEPSKGLRPLGFTSPSHKTFGLGSHAFTWRNISNTCPLVFWWEANGWYPLFSVKNRG